MLLFMAKWKTSDLLIVSIIHCNWNSHLFYDRFQTIGKIALWVIEGLETRSKNVVTACRQSTLWSEPLEIFTIWTHFFPCDFTRYFKTIYQIHRVVNCEIQIQIHKLINPIVQWSFRSSTIVLQSKQNRLCEC